MKNWLVGFTLLLTVVGWEQRAQSETLSKASSEFIYKVSTVLVRLPPSVCEQQLTQISKSSALRVQKDLKWNGAPKLAEYAKAVPDSERERPKVKAALVKANAFLACLKHIDDELAGLDKRIELNSGFRKAAAAAQATIESLHSFVPHPDSPMWTVDAKQFAKWKSDLEMVNDLCVGPYKDLTFSGAFADDPNHNLTLWCQTAASRDRILKQAAMNMVNKQVSMMVKAFEAEVKNFESTSGHLRLAGAIQIAALYSPDAYRSTVAERANPILALAGLKLGAALEPFDAIHTALWDKIRTAGTGWKHMPQQGREASAVKAAKKRFKADKVVAAYMTRDSWKEDRNPRGEVIGRSKIGVVRYKVKSDKTLAGPLCRTQTFTYYEQKVGRRFKKASDISELGFVRFENCK